MMENVSNRPLVGIIAGALIVVTAISFFYRGNGQGIPSLSVNAAWAELKNPQNEQQMAGAMATIRKLGDEAVPQLLEIVQHPPKPASLSLAAQILLSLPASPKVVGSIVTLMETSDSPEFRRPLVFYLGEATEKKLGDDPKAWRNWWETEGKSKTTFSAPYGTCPAGTSK